MGSKIFLSQKYQEIHTDPRTGKLNNEIQQDHLSNITFHKRSSGSWILQWVLDPAVGFTSMSASRRRFKDVMSALYGRLAPNLHTQLTCSSGTSCTYKTLTCSSGTSCTDKTLTCSSGRTLPSPGLTTLTSLSFMSRHTCCSWCTVACERRGFLHIARSRSSSNIGGSEVKLQAEVRSNCRRR